MGGAASRPANGNAYSKQAAEAKKLPDQILTLFFSNANLMKLLKLHNIGECSRFVFTTSSELVTLFQKLQIYPKLGEKGEILFAPVSELAPGLLSDADKNASNQARLQEKMHSRNELCVDIAYFYVRIFQIYSALALTVIDADPLRRKRFMVAQNPIYNPRPQSAPLGGGYRPVVGSGPMLVLASPGQKMQVQLGGGIARSGPQKPLFDSITKTALEPLVGILKASLPLDTSNQTITFDDNRSGKTGILYIKWTYPNSMDITLEGEFKKTGGERIPITLNAIKTKVDNIDNVRITISGAGVQIYQELKKPLSGWEFVYDLGEGKPSEPYGFYDKIYSEFTQETDKDKAGQGQVQVQGQGISSIASASAFEGFDKLKKIFEDKTKKGTEFPKAYCMARLMTLINPVFDSEVIPGQPYYSQICRKKFDFETEPYMPRAGTAAKSNTYIRSFTSLFYDDYKYNRGTGKLELTQTEPSRSSLRDASNKFAKMYNIAGDQPNFLFESGGAVNFTVFKVCEGKDDRLLRIKQDKLGKEFLATLKTDCVKKMLDFQQDHTIKVNKLLMKMFKIESTKNSQPVLKLQPAIKAGGKDAINAIGVEAHDLLMDYYLKSEALYIRGVTLFENNVNAYESV